MRDAARELFQRIQSLFRRPSLDAEFDAELAAHLDLATQENQRAGMSAEEARRRAVLRLGGVQQSREQHREARGLPSLESFTQDVRYTLRTLRRDSVFTLIAVLVLAVGIGANAAIFSLVNGIVLRPLPLHNPQQLIWISEKDGKSGLSSLTFSVDAYEGFLEENRSFEDVTGYFPFSTPENERLQLNGEPMPATSISVLGNFFPMLGVAPYLGRSFTQEECKKNGPPAVLLAYPFWQSRFAGDMTIVGRNVALSGRSVTVVGVMPKSFDFGAVFSPGTRVDMYVPIVSDEMRDWGNVLCLVGRLKPGIPLGRAQAEADRIAPQLYWNRKYANSNGVYTMKLQPLKEYVSGRIRRSLIVLWCAVGFILLIVCVNLSNLLLARLGARSKEFAMRAALGASRTRLIRQLLTETLLLTGAGAMVGLGFAYAALVYLAHQTSIALPLLNNIQLNGRAFLWTILISVCAAVLFGVAPGLRLSSANLESSLKDMGHGMSAGRRHQSLRTALVVVEVALACVLMTGSGLLLRSFLRVLNVDLGFQPSHAVAMQVMEADSNAGLQKRAATLNETLRRTEMIPGVMVAGISDSLPLGMNRSWNLAPAGDHDPKWNGVNGFLYVVTPGYMEAMGMRLREGRRFDWHDDQNSQPVVILNEAAAHTLWPNQNALNRFASINGQNRRIVGVVSDVRESSLEKKAGLQMYLPVGQVRALTPMLVVRSTLPTDVLAPALLSALRSVNPDQAKTELRPLQASVDQSVSPRRFFVVLVTAFATLGLFLAALGIYGVISYSVTQQRQEIGIRMALGATAGRVQAAIVWQTLRLAVIGVVLGTAAAIIMARLIASLLFETAPADPVAFLMTVVVLGMTALFASLIPAQRASRVDPMIALRNT